MKSEREIIERIKDIKNMQDRFKCKIAVFERYNSDAWEFIKFIENNDKYGVSTNGNVIHENVQGLIIHLPREKTPENIYRTMEPVQCTGFKDKNGKLIYENDIVANVETNYFQRYVVGWNNHGFWMLGNYAMAGCAKCLEENYEIIGNMYESPELLMKTTGM